MSNIFENKSILVGVTGSIAVYKSCDLVSRLVDRGAKPKVVMTESARRFVAPISFEALTGEPVVTTLWERTQGHRSAVHISLAQSVDCAVIAPATANMIAKIRMGMADEILSSIMCAFDKPVIIAPAMNNRMLENPGVSENMGVLKQRGFNFVPTGEGKLVCGTRAKGRMADVCDIIDFIERVLVENA